jgi:hypothetical protein
MNFLKQLKDLSFMIQVDPIVEDPDKGSRELHVVEFEDRSSCFFDNLSIIAQGI